VSEGDREQPYVKEASIPDKRDQAPRIPPRWFIRLAWLTHRGLYRFLRHFSV
jgi:hypothetical protein